jgi:hypothetical protein
VITAIGVGLVTIIVVAVLLLSARLVGQVAEEFGEDPATWQARMLPFGMFGPVLARAILNRRNGGGRGGYA